MNIHRLRVVDYDTVVNEDEDNSAITEHDEVSGNSQKDSNDAKVKVDGKTTTSDENGGGDQIVTTDSTTNPALQKRLCLRKRRSNNELFRFPSPTKLKKHACKNTSSSEDLKKNYKTNERSNHRSRYNLIFNRDSILNVHSKGGDLKKSRNHDNRNEECNDRFHSQKLNLTTREKNQSREKSHTPKLSNDMFGFQKSNRRFDPCLCQMSCHFFDIDNHSAFNVFKKPFRRKQLRKKTPNEAKNKHHQVRVLNTEEHVNPKDESDKYYNITANENSHKQRLNRKPYVDTWRRDHTSFHLRKDANVFVSPSALAPVTKYCIDRACGCSPCEIAHEKQSSSEHKSLNMKSQSVTCECVKFSSGFLNTMTACDANLPRTNTTRSSMKNICLGLLIFVWSPCLLAVILALIIIFPWRMSHLLGNNGLKSSCANSSFLNKFTPKCLVHECQQIRSRYSKSQKRRVLSSVASWFTRVAGSAATSVNAMLSLVKLDKNIMPTCAGSSFVPKGTGKHPNPKNRYNLYHANDRGWVMKPVYHRSLYQNMRCEHSPKARHSSRLKKHRSLKACCTSKDDHTILKVTDADGCHKCSKTSSKNKGEACCCTSKDLNPPPTYPCSPITKQVNIISKQNSTVGVKKKSNTVCSCMYQPTSAYTNTVKLDKTAYLPHYCVGMLYGITPNYPCGIHCGGIVEQNTQIQKATCKKHQSTSIEDISNLHRTGIEQTQQSKITQTVFSDKIDKTHVSQDRLIKSYPNQQASDLHNRALRLVNRDCPLTSNSYQQTSYTPYTSENGLSHILESKFRKEFSNKLKRGLRDVRNNQLVDRATSYTPAIITGKRSVNKSNNILQNKLLHCNTVFDKRLANLHPTKSPLFKRDSNWICAIEEQGATPPFMPKAEQQVSLKERSPEKAVNTSQKKSISFVRTSKIPKAKQSILGVQSKGIFPSASMPQSKKDSDPRETTNFLSFMKTSPMSVLSDLIKPKNLAIFVKMSHCSCEYDDTEEVPLYKIKTNVFEKDEIMCPLKKVLPFLKTAAECCKAKFRKANLLVAKAFQRTKKIICDPSHEIVKISDEKIKQMPYSLDKIKIPWDVVVKKNETKTEIKGTATSLSLKKALKHPTNIKATNTSKIIETLNKFGQAKKESAKRLLSHSSPRELIDELRKTCFARFETTGTQTSRDKACECCCATKEVGPQTDLVEQKKCKAAITKTSSPLQNAPNCGYKTKQTNTFPCDGQARECGCQTKITDTPRSRKIAPKCLRKVGKTQTDKANKKLSELTNQYTKREASTSYKKVSKTKEQKKKDGHRTQETSTSPSLEKAFQCPLNTKATKTSPSLEKPIECPCNTNETKTLPVLAKAIVCGCRTKETNTAPSHEKAVQCGCRTKETNTAPSHEKAVQCGCKIKRKDKAKKKRSKESLSLEKACKRCCMTKETNTSSLRKKTCERCCQIKETNTSSRHKQASECDRETKESKTFWSPKKASDCAYRVNKTQTHVAKKMSVDPRKPEVTQTRTLLEKAIESHFENIDKSVSVIVPCDGAYENVFTQTDLTKSLDEALSHHDQFPSDFCLGEIKPPKQKRQLKVSQHLPSQKKTLHNQPRQKLIKSHRHVKQSHQTHSWSINREHTNVTENWSPSKSPQNLIPCQATFISNTHENQLPQDQCNSSMDPKRTDIPQNLNQSTSTQNCSQLELFEIRSPQESFISYQHDLQSRRDQSTLKESKTSHDFISNQASLYNKSTVSLQNSPQKISSRESYPMNPKGANGRTYEIPKQYQRRLPQRLSLSPDLPSGLSDEPHDVSYNTSVPTWNKVITTNGPQFRFSKLKSKPVRVPVISNNCFCSDEELQERRNPSAKLLSYSLRKPDITNKIFQQPKKPYSTKTKFSQYSVRAVSSQTSITSLVRSCQSSSGNQASFSSLFTSHRILKNVPKIINCTRPEKYNRWLKFEYNSDILNKTSSNNIYKSSHTSKTPQRISLLNNKHMIASKFVGNKSQWTFNKPNQYSQKFIQHSHPILDQYTRKSKLSKSTQIRYNTPSHTKPDNRTGKQNVKRLLSKCNQTSKHLFFVTDNSLTKLFKPSHRFSHKTILKDRSQQTFSQTLPTNRCVTPRCEQRTGMSGLSICVHSKQELSKHSCHNKTSLESRLQPGLSNNFFYNQPTSSQHIEPFPKAHIPTNKSNPPPYYLFPYPHYIFGPVVHPGQRLDIAQVSSPHSFRCPLSEQNDLCSGPVLNNSVCPANKQSASGHTEPCCKYNILSKKSLRKQQSCQTAGREKEMLPYIESDNSLNKHEQASVQIECKCSDEDVLERQQYPSEDTDGKTREIPRITKRVGCTAKQSLEHTNCESFNEKSCQNQQYQSEDTHMQAIKEKSLQKNGVCCTKECYDKKIRQSQYIVEKQSHRQMSYLPCSGAPLNYRRKTFISPEKAKRKKLPSKELCEKEKIIKFDQATLDRCEQQKQKMILKQKKVKAEVKKAKMKKTRSEELSCWQQIKEAIKESEDQAWPLEDNNCNRMYIHTLKHRPHLWLFKLWPSLYPYFINVFKVHSCVCQMLLYITTACLCCPFFLCLYYCSRGLLCHVLG